jgi:hypothetical protein
MRCGGQRACNPANLLGPALASAVLFGASTPLSKLLLGAGRAAFGISAPEALLRRAVCSGPGCWFWAEPDNGRNHGAAMLNNPSIEYFPAPVMHNSRKPPIMLRFL